MTLSTEAKALAFALLAASISLGGAWLAAIPIHVLMKSSVSQAGIISPTSPQSTAAATALVAQGRQFFTMSCVECHGDDAHGDEGPDLHNLAISDARMAATVKRGVKGEMPSFAKKYDDLQVKALVAYLRSLR